MAEQATRDTRENGDEQRGPLTAELIAESLGEISDAKMAAVLATGATVEEFEEALAWATGESDVMGELEKRLDGTAALVYDILTSEEQFPEDEPRD